MTAPMAIPALAPVLNPLDFELPFPPVGTEVPDEEEEEAVADEPPPDEGNDDMVDNDELAPRLDDVTLGDADDIAVEAVALETDDVAVETGAVKFAGSKWPQFCC